MKMLRFCSVYLPAIVALTLSPAGLAATAFACPPTLSVDQRIVTVPTEWTGIDDQSEAPLARIAFYLGHPSERGSLVPDSTRRSHGEERVTWTFPRKPGDEFWLGCTYGNTLAQLTRKLDDGIARRDVKYALGKNGKRAEVRQVICNH